MRTSLRVWERVLTRGRELGATPRTVAKYLERIHRKLGVDSRIAAAARAHEIWAAPAD